MAYRPKLTRIACAIFALGMTSAPNAALVQWQGGDSDWSDGANWSGGSVPGVGDDVEVTDGLGGATTVDYNETANPNYKTLLIDGVTVVHQDTGALSVQEMTVGSAGTAAYQLGVGQQLQIGSGGRLVVGALDGSSGSIVQNHADSVVQVGGDGGDLILGEQAGALGSYSLVGGTLNVAAALVVGDAGTGVFTQDGGDVSAGQLVLGRAAGGFGTYDLNGGTLNDQLIVGDAGTGVFNNNGFTHNVTGELILGNQATGDGTYNLDGGGSLTVSGGTPTTFVGNAGVGTFNHIDGTADLQTLVLGAQSGGQGTYTIDAGTLTINGDLGIGTTDPTLGFPSAAGKGAFVQNGGAVIVNGAFYQDGVDDGAGGATSRYTLNDGSLSSGSFASMSNKSLFDQTGGTHTNSGLFIVGNSGGSDYDTVYNISGATAVASFNDLWVGGFGRGILNQTDGTVNVAGQLRVGDGPNIDPTRRYGKYNLSGGTLDASNNVVIGVGNSGSAGEPGGLGTFTQTGGAALVGGNLIVGGGGDIGGGTGTYTMSAGTVTVSGLTRVGEAGLGTPATGVFNHSGGTHTTPELYIGSGNASGTYNLSGTGVLQSGVAYVGEGGVARFNQSGGTFNTDFLNVGIFTGADSILAMTAGTINVANNLSVGGGASAINARVDQSGGQVFVNDPSFGLFVGNAGKYTLSGGATLDVATNVSIGNGGGGEFEQHGTSVHTIGGGLLVGDLAGAVGSYKITGGQLQVNGSTGIVVARDGTGTFTQQGGSTAASKLDAGVNPGKVGNFNLSGGVVNIAGQARFGVEGIGNLSIADGSFNVVSGGSLIAGALAGGSATVSVFGAGVLAVDNRLTLGEFGSALMGQNGANTTVTAGGLRVGAGAGSTGNYQLHDGVLNVVNTNGVDGGTRVGLVGSGTFVQNGGTHNTTFMQIGGATFGQGSGGTGVYQLNGGNLVSTGTIGIRPNADSASGTLNVAGGALTAPLIVNNDKLNYSGGAITANVDNNAQFNVSGGAPRTLTGTLNNNAGGTTTVAAATPLSISGNLNRSGGSIAAAADIIVGSDYTNTGFTSGNTFDRRAGVTGAGQIQGLNAAQTITATTNPGALTPAGANTFTLDIGAVRGNGSKTVNYQVANNGTGASIRGAIQTAANGGNITDARLSGSGVTAGNFGPIAAGGNSGNLAVTMSGATGGALTGQTIAVYSNFENVPTQLINLSGLVTTLAQGNATPSPGPVNLGNFRVGGTQPSQDFAVQNTASGAGAERLGIAATPTMAGNFSAVNNLGAGFINPGSSLANAITASVAGGVAGVNNGSMAIQYTTNGQLIDGSFGTINANQQNIALTATGYRVAAPVVTGNLNFGNVLVGTTQERFITVSNNALADGFSEGLNAGFGAITGTGAGLLSGTGSLTNLAAGASDNTTLKVTLNTGAAGSVNASVEVVLASNGATTSGLGILNLPSEFLQSLATIQAQVGNLAVAGLAPTSVNFGKFREGQVSSQTQQLTISNLAVGPAEGLNAAFGGTSGGASHNGGSIASLAAGGSNNSSMSATLNGLATAGAKSGTVTVDFESDGSFNSGVPTALPSQSVTMNAEVYRLAQASVTPSVALAARRVGDAAATGTLNIANTAANDGYSEGLRGTIGAAPAGFTVAPPATTGLIAAGGSESRTVSLSTAAAGSFGGNVNVALESDGAGTSGFSAISIGSADVAVSGKVYTPAVAQLNTPVISFGVVRKGDVVAAQNVTVTNAAAATALNDTMKASAGGAVGPFTAGGSSAGLGAGQSNAGGTLVVGLSTASAGVFNGSATVAFVSQNPDMADLDLGSEQVTLSAQVNEIAKALFSKSGGAGSFGCLGLVCTLDFGNLLIGSGSSTGILALTNDVTGPADDLMGSFNLAGLGDFLGSGFGAVDLAAGATLGGLTLSFDALNEGLFTGSFAFNGISHNDSQSDLVLDAITVNLRANVVRQGSVPEPGTLALLLLAGIAALATRRRMAH